MKVIFWYALGVVVLVDIIAFGWWTLSPLFIDRVVDEVLPYETKSPTSGTVSFSTKKPDTPTDDTTEQTLGPVVRAEGTFVGADTLHRGSGTARIVDTADGPILRLEDFEVTNGPDLYVLLAKSAAPRTHNDFGEYVELAQLKGNIGNQNYLLPADIDADAYGSVVIYCKAFSVVFATAALR